MVIRKKPILSISKKLVLSNIAMIMIPSLFIFILLTISADIFDKYLINLGSQKEFTNIIQIMDFAGDKEKSSDVNKLCMELESKGISLDLTVNHQAVYISTDFEAVKAQVGSNAQNFQNVSQYNYTSDTASEIYQMRKTDNGIITLHLLKSGQIAIDMGRDDFISQAELWRKLLLVVFLLAVAVIIVTNFFLTSFISQSILKPLKILHEGTNQIQQGNLDYEVKYEKGDEFGAICADFEEMRTRLKESVAEQARYEESRKELIAGISHDLATPLTHIKGYVSGIIEGVACTPEKINDYLMTINTTAENMKKMVNNLFLFSKLDINGVPFYFSKVNLVEFVQSYYEEIKNDLNKRGMKLDYHSSCTEAFVNLDVIQFERVLFNLVDNSVKYKKGSAGMIIMNIAEDGSHVLLAIQDNGWGIAQEEVDKIFDIFYRTDRARGETEKGSGLGLAIVRQIVTSHGGKVWANSDKNNGLEIIISLPKATEEVS